MSVRGPRRLWVAALFGLACGRAEPGSTAQTSAAADGPGAALDRVLGDPEAASAGSAVPATRSGFLRELAPLPGEAVRVAYDVRAAAGIVGELEVLLAPGALRREAWRLQVPVPIDEAHPDGRLDVEGLAIQRPEGLWVGGRDGGAGTITPSPLAGLADAYAAADGERRAAIVGALRAWHAELAQARAEAPGEQRTVLGVPCQWTRIAAQTVCVWEATGLPLRYEGAGLTIVARAVDTDAAFDAGAFEWPPRATAAERLPAPAIEGAVPQKLLERLAAGEVDVLAQWLQPGLRLPEVVPTTGD